MTTPNPNLSELRRLAEGAAALPKKLPRKIDYNKAMANRVTWEKFKAACDPATILALLDMVEGQLANNPGELK